MNRIDPLGRTLVNDFGIIPFACWCSPGDTYTDGKTDYGDVTDDCKNCGCTCNPSLYKTGGRPYATDTNRASTP